jgi:signal transduction histidine kinase/DNA-binding response OmpR family regulator
MTAALNPPLDDGRPRTRAASPTRSATWRPRLRRSTIVVLVAAFMALIALQFIAGRYLYMDGFEEAERRDLLARARHAQAVLAQGIDALSSAATDYAEWQATVEFARGQRPEYPEYNWQAWTLQRFQADAVIIIDMRGRALLGRGLDARRLALAPLPPEELAAVASGEPLGSSLQESTAHAGYAFIGERPYAWAAAAVHRDAQAQLGWLILLRRLDAPWIAALDRTLDARIGFELAREWPLLTPAPSMPVRLEELRFGAASAREVRAGFAAGVVPGVGRMTVSLATDRALMGTVARMSGYFFWASLAVGTFIALLTMGWLQRRLLGPLRDISERLGSVGSSSNLAVRLPLVGRGDEITAVAIAANRMLDQIEATHEAELARDAAVIASRAKGDFLARMSHEIRTPMNGVLGMTELLANTTLDRRQEQCVTAIRRSAENLLEIINDILDFSKIEAGKLELDDGPIDLVQLAEEALELLAERAQSRGLELLGDLSPDLHAAYRGDALRLRQVIVNLLGNAIKFTRRGQVVLRISGGGAADGALEALRFEIEDSGIGIAPADQARIFDSFSQVDGSTTRRYGGTGLGLTICRQLVGLMNGEIGVQSAPERGSTFWFTARLTRVPAAGRPIDTAVLAGRRALVLDDNPGARRILRRHLESWGMVVAEAAETLTALGLLQSLAAAGTPCDLVLLDHRMADADGLQAARLIRASPALRGVGVVLLSELTPGLPEEQWRAAGVGACITKPVRVAPLRSCLRRMLGHAADSAETLPALPHPQTAPPPLDLRVLLVEDNPVNQEVGRSMLVELGCEVEVAADGSQGVSACLARPFDVVLMDCQMPVMDGYEATREIRGRQRLAGSQRSVIIALTANAFASDREQCLAAGMDDYLSKPFLLQQLRLVLTQHAAAARAARRLGVLDGAALQRLQALPPAGAGDPFGGFIGGYLADAPQRLQQLLAALAAGDAPAVADAARALQTSSADVGAGALAELAARLELMGHSGDLPRAVLAVEQLQSEYQRVLDALRAEKRSA